MKNKKLKRQIKYLAFFTAAIVFYKVLPFGWDLFPAMLMGYLYAKALVQSKI